MVIYKKKIEIIIYLMSTYKSFFSLIFENNTPKCYYGREKTGCNIEAAKWSKKIVKNYVKKSEKIVKNIKKYCKK